MPASNSCVPSATPAVKPLLILPPMVLIAASLSFLLTFFNIFNPAPKLLLKAAKGMASDVPTNPLNKTASAFCEPSIIPPRSKKLAILFI